MSVRVNISEGALGAAEPVRVDGAGAVVVFEGVVRRMENGEALVALEYQAYEPMASRQLMKLGEELAGRFGMLRVFVEHSRGRVAVGEVSFRLMVAAPHRKEALQAMDQFIDRMKKDVPIWKKPVWARTAGGSPITKRTRA